MSRAVTSNAIGIGAGRTLYQTDFAGLDVARAPGELTETAPDARTILSRNDKTPAVVPLVSQTELPLFSTIQVRPKDRLRIPPAGWVMRQKNCRCDRPLAAIIDGGTRG